MLNGGILSNKELQTKCPKRRKIECKNWNYRITVQHAYFITVSIKNVFIFFFYFLISSAYTEIYVL